MVTERIIQFLNSRNWTRLKEGDQFAVYSAPEGLGLPEGFLLHVPLTDQQNGFERYYTNLINVLADLYGISEEDLHNVIGTSDTILRVRIHDDETSQGKINFVRFEGFIERLKAIITDTASFVIDRDLNSIRVPAEAQRYVNKCHFLQTEKGSYVTKIQLPREETIKDATLFTPKIIAEEINEKLIEVLDYVNTQIFQGDVGLVSDDYIVENSDKLNVKLLRDIETLYDKSEIKNIAFSLQTVNETKVVTSENITKAQIHRLNTFIETVSSRSFEENVVTVRGKIELLKSRDPDGGRNSITMQGLLDDLPVLAKANLTSDMYKEAIEAHKVKDYVEIRGLARVSRTRIQFKEIEVFTVG
jgi:hypothetical protein